MPDWTPKRDAKKDVNTVGSLCTGCLLMPAGVGSAYFIKPEPESTCLIGKSSEYVSVYTNTYKTTARNIQTNFSNRQ